MHPPGLAFDVGRGESRLSGADDLFLSHGHLDHCLGIPFVLSHRTLHRSQRTRVFCPAAISETLNQLIEAAERLEEASYQYELVPFEPGSRVDVGPDLLVEAFETLHVVPSLGYVLKKRRRKLAAAYRGLSGGEIVRLKSEGVSVSEEFEEAWVAYCGDTRIELFEKEPFLLSVPVLIVECTFMGPGMRDRGARYGHIHLEDLAEYSDRFENEVIVLSHLSRRYRTRDLREQVNELLGDMATRVVIVGERDLRDE